MVEKLDLTNIYQGFFFSEQLNSYGGTRNKCHPHIQEGFDCLNLNNCGCLLSVPGPRQRWKPVVRYILSFAFDTLPSPPWFLLKGLEGIDWYDSDSDVRLSCVVAVMYCEVEVRMWPFICIDLVLVGSAWSPLLGYRCQLLTKAILLPCQCCVWPDAGRTEALTAGKLSNTHTLPHNTRRGPNLSHTGVMI